MCLRQCNEFQSCQYIPVILTLLVEWSFDNVDDGRALRLCVHTCERECNDSNALHAYVCVCVNALQFLPSSSSDSDDAKSRSGDPPLSIHTQTRTHSLTHSKGQINLRTVPVSSKKKGGIRISIIRLVCVTHDSITILPRNVCVWRGGVCACVCVPGEKRVSRPGFSIVGIA